jgi:hypothetical protein
MGEPKNFQAQLTAEMLVGVANAIQREPYPGGQ